MQRRDFLALMLAAPALRSRMARADAAQPCGLVDVPGFDAHLLAEDHPEAPARTRAIRRAIAAAGLAGRLVPIEPRGDAEQHLSLVHPTAHVEAIRRDVPHHHRHALLGVGGALAAVDAVCGTGPRQVFVASRPPGHHAFDHGREHGFCFYDNVAIAARHAQRVHGVRRVLIVDWDYHHGDGTERIFYADPDVLVFSTHDWHAFPGTGDPARRGTGAGLGFNVNVHLPCGTDDAGILAAFREELLPRAERFRPELVLVSAGFDSRVDDLLGCFAVTDAGFAALTRLVQGIARRHAGGRLVSVLEGGYQPRGTASAVVRHLATLLEA